MGVNMYLGIKKQPYAEEKKNKREKRKEKEKGYAIIWLYIGRLILALQLTSNPPYDFMLIG